GGSAFIAHHRQAVGNIAFNNNTNIGAVGGIFVSGEVRSTIGIDILNNTASVNGNLGRNALYLQTANNGVAGTDNSTMCANVSGNTFTESPNNTGFQATIVLDTVSNQGVVNLENWNGSSPTYDVFLSSQNTLSGGSPNVIADNSANIHAGGNCVSTTPLLLRDNGLDSLLKSPSPASSFVLSPLTGFSSPAYTSRSHVEDVGRSLFTELSTVSASLDQQHLDSIITAAIDHWSATGLTVKQVATLRD